MNSKQLHRHALPILVLSTGLFVTGLVIATTLFTPDAPSTSFISTLFNSRLLTIHTTPSGTLAISRYASQDDTSEIQTGKPTSQSSELMDMSSVGKSTQLDFMLR